MDNYDIAEQLSLLSKLMDIHGAEPEMAKALSTAAFSLEKFPRQIAEMPKAQIFKIKNIGDAAGEKIIELIETGELHQLKELLVNTPEGVLEMLNIKGIGPKKINTLWKHMKIDTIEALYEACKEKRLSAVKGFGEKTEEKILESIQFAQSNVGKYLYYQVESFAEAFLEKLKQKFNHYKTEITGEFRRHLEVISMLEFVTTTPKEPLKNYVLNEQVLLTEETQGEITLLAEKSLRIKFHLASKENFAQKLFETSSSEDFLHEWKNFSENTNAADTEEQIFSSEGINYIPPFLREKPGIIRAAEACTFESLLQVSDIKGLIHAHSNWSDGVHTIEQMVKALIDLGFEYLVISDHSKAAYYAGGLHEDRIKKQHEYINELNEKYSSFKIFKSIECDILSDGALDYSNDVLASFDLVITSIHSNLQMTQEKAMKRLLGAITNPYTTILGHMTGRKLLKRTGYPVDYQAVIDACAENHVVIEINANPNRLDMDWRWVDYALQKNVMLSINPDAHSIDEFQFVKYGVLVAQKGGLQPKQNLSSYSLKEFQNFLGTLKAKKTIS